MAVLFTPPYLRIVDSANVPIPGAFVGFYSTQTSTLQPVYSDAGLTTALLNPVQADGNGDLPVIWLDDSLPAYKYVIYMPDVTTPSIPGDVIRSGDPYNFSLSANAIADIETAAGVTPVNKGYEVLDPRRYATTADWSAVYAAVSTLAQSYPGWYRGDHAQHPSLTNAIVGFQSYDDSQKTGTVGYRCTVFGVQALQQNKNSVTAGGTNTAFGWAVLENCVECSGNTAVGATALNSLTGVNSSHNNAFGYRVLTLLVDGAQNNCFGFQVLNSLTTGNNNHCFGENTASSVTSGNGLHAFGYQCLFSKTTGDNTHAFGYQCLFSETTGSANTAFGYQAGQHLTTKSNNVIIGYQAANANAVGDSNTIVGFQAGQAVNNGDLNCLIGYQAGLRITSGASNTVIGQQAGNNITTGTENVCIGDNAGQAITTVQANVMVGGITGVNLNGNSNTCVGYNAGSVGSAQTYTNVQCFGNNAAPTASNQVVLGNASIATLRCQQTTITALSDQRFKENIADLEIPDEFIEQVRIVTFDWTHPDMPKGQQMGVIAQQLDALQEKFGLQWMGLVDKTNPDKIEATPGKLLFPLLVKVQQQSKLLAKLEKRLKALEDK